MVHYLNLKFQIPTFSFLTAKANSVMKYTLWIHVMKGTFTTNLLGQKMAIKMGLVHRVDGLELFENVFGDIELLKCQPVELRPDATPYSIATPQHVSFPILSQVEEEIKQMQSLGSIEEVKRPQTGVALWCPYSSDRIRNPEFVWILQSSKKQ